jgi:hypothetical protein
MSRTDLPEGNAAFEPDRKKLEAFGQDPAIPAKTLTEPDGFHMTSSG